TASFGIDNWNHLGSLLFMAGFSGHTVILSLARGVTDPNEFNTIFRASVATSIYALIGCAGYLMFGKSVSQEISMELVRTPGYNAALNQAALFQ
ncbi:hypothetical protein B0H14DRAFT_2753411, partial [Mycena olivaceomarginata]